MMSILSLSSLSSLFFVLAFFPGKISSYGINRVSYAVFLEKKACLSVTGSPNYCWLTILSSSVNQSIKQGVSNLYHPSHSHALCPHLGCLDRDGEKNGFPKGNESVMNTWNRLGAAVWEDKPFHLIRFYTGGWQLWINLTEDRLMGKPNSFTCMKNSHKK